MEHSSYSLGVSLKNIAFGSGLQFSKSKPNRKEVVYLDYFLHRLLFCDYDDEESYWFYVEIFGREREEARATTRTFFKFWQLVYEKSFFRYSTL